MCRYAVLLGTRERRGLCLVRRKDDDKHSVSTLISDTSFRETFVLPSGK